MKQPIVEEKNKKTIEIAMDFGLEIVCPKCKWTSNKGMALTISLDDINGDFCMYCYCQWIVKNVPKMVEKKERKSK